MPLPGESIDMQRYRLLKELSFTTYPAFNTADTPRDDMRAYKELLDAGYMQGDFVPDQQGFPEVFGGLAITHSGRDYLRELETSLFHSVRPSFFSRHRSAILSWFFGLLATIISGVVVWLLTH